MNTRTRQLGWASWVPLVALAFILLCAGCDKKCQPPAEQSFKTFTGQKWRMVETTDPDPNFKKLNNATFLIFEFNRDYTGTVNKVLNNVNYDTPVRTFFYNVDVNAGLIRTLFQDPSQATDSEQDLTGASAIPSMSGQAQGAVEYSYSLGRDFELTETRKGYYYRFVPFTGIVEPDRQCVF